jgi:hypothetical protein
MQSKSGREMTLGWIKEDVEERFFEAMARTGLANSGSPGHASRQCPVCHEWFGTFGDLNSHLHERHSVRRPFLLLDGREPGKEDAVRRALPKTLIETVDADTIDIGVDQAPTVPADLPALRRMLGLSGSRQLEVRLWNGGPSSRTRQSETYRLRVRIASPAALKRADLAFVRWFGEGTPHIGKIDNLKSTAGNGAVDDYVDALCEYVRGVLNKDCAPETGIRGTAEDWTIAYNRSLQVLAEAPRPLAALLCGLMRFALNDFSQWRQPTGFPLLDDTMATLGPLTEGWMPEKAAMAFDSVPRRTVCPIDSGVDQLVGFNRRVAELNRWSVIDDEAARHMASSMPLGRLDRAKACAMWAFAALRLGAKEAAQEPLTLLQNNDCFGPWAAAQLAGLET